MWKVRCFFHPFVLQGYGHDVRQKYCESVVSQGDASTIGDAHWTRTSNLLSTARITLYYLKYTAVCLEYGHIQEPSICSSVSSITGVISMGSFPLPVVTKEEIHTAQAKNHRCMKRYVKVCFKSMERRRACMVIARSWQVTGVLLACTIVA